MSEQGGGKSSHAYKIWEPLLLAIVAVIGMVAGAKLASYHSSQGNVVSRDFGAQAVGADRISEMIRFIDAKYVDQVDSEEMIENAIKSIMGELDPHSSYISPEDLKELEEKMQGSYEGIGIEFHRIRDTVAVIYVFPGGPAEQAGMEIGDRIVTVGDSSITGADLSNEKIIRSLKGRKGTSVTIGVARSQVDTLIPVTISRGKIPIHSVIAGYMLDEETGYIKLNRFSSNSYKEFMSKLELLVEDYNMKHLVIDVRQNPGGYLKESVNMLSQLFKEKGKLLVYTEGAKSKRMEYKTTGKPFFDVGNIAVLIDGGSASASEIVAGAIKDHDRGVVIGSQSFGKGLVQEQFSLQNGGALRLTIARYYTPSGRLIQKPYAEEDNSASSDTSAYFTSNGRKVYSLGGIEPDIKMDEDSMWRNKEIKVLYDKVIEYVFHLIPKANHLEGFTSVNTFLENFPSEQDIKDDFFQYYQDQETKMLFKQDDQAIQQIYTLVQAMTASYYFGREAWYEVVNKTDNVIQKAQEMIHKDRAVTLKL